MKLIIANLKMNMKFNKLENYIKNLNKEIIICPSYVHIPYFSNNIVSAQDCYYEDLGSYTSYISPLQLKEIGVSYVLIGHSERRNIDTNEIILLKIKACMRNNLKIILCIGENNNENKYDKLIEQLSVLNNLELDSIIIAYEPIWAIGTGKIPTNLEIYETINFIKEKYKIPVLYGGSVDSSNIDVLNKIKNIDGFLVGKASIEYEQINLIYNKVNN